VKIVRTVAIALSVLLGVFFMIRAVVELLTIDYSDPTSYANDWGGPSLAGVLLVHCGLGVVSAIAFIYGWRRTRTGPQLDAGRDERG
jgi:hypothetical protein